MHALWNGWHWQYVHHHVPPIPVEAGGFLGVDALSIINLLGFTNTIQSRYGAQR